MPAMDPDTAIAETEQFLAAWNDNCMQHLGHVIAQAGFDRDTPLLTTTHLHTLLNALHAAKQREDGARTQWGVWWPETRTVNRTEGEETARGWIREYAAIVGPDAAEKPRVMRRTVGAGPWQDADAGETAAVRPAGGTTGPAESQRTHTGANGPQRSAQGDETDGGNCGG